jgi:hypothetical protein
MGTAAVLSELSQMPAEQTARTWTPDKKAGWEVSDMHSDAGQERLT